MHYTLNYAEKWIMSEIYTIIDDTEGNNILTRINPEKFSTLSDLHPIVSKIDFTYILKNIILFFNNKILYSDILEIIKSIEITHLYDPNIHAIFHKNIVNQIVKKISNLVHRYQSPHEFNKNRIGIISAGLSELNFVTTCFIIMLLDNNNIIPYIDCGVDKIITTHDLITELKKNKLNIVIAGMENALSHVISELIDTPTICVPSSCSYGYGDGESALLSLLTCQNKGMIIFNINNIYGASIFSNKMLSIKHKLNIGILSSLPIDDTVRRNIFCDYKSQNIIFNTYQLTISDIFSNIKSSYDMISMNNVIFTVDDSAVYTNIIAGFLNHFDKSIPVIGLGSHDDKMKILLNGCVPYGVIIDKSVNLLKLLTKMETLIK